MNGFFVYLGRLSKARLRFATLLFVVVVGLGDYLAGYEVSFSIFYLAAISVGAWLIGRPFAWLLSALSVICWIGGDFAAGAKFANPFVPMWNATIAFAFYLIMVEMLSNLRTSQDQLEGKVRERTAALTLEMNKREDLEKELLAVSERERRLIGHDLHDSLCQHLTATALAGQVLGEKLAARSLPEADDASRVVELIEDSITLARNLARGLSPLQLESDGLEVALESLAATAADQFKIDCQFVCETADPLDDLAAATHIYRNSQEAISNAVRHGKARSVTLTLTGSSDAATLRIEDDGTGLPAFPPRREGMGLRIMAHRAAILGGQFSIRRRASGGTVAECNFKYPSCAGVAVSQDAID